jgi:hypothetical protein
VGDSPKNSPILKTSPAAVKGAGRACNDFDIFRPPAFRGPVCTQKLAALPTEQ